MSQATHPYVTAAVQLHLQDCRNEASADLQERTSGGRPCIIIIMQSAGTIVCELWLEHPGVVSLQASLCMKGKHHLMASCQSLPLQQAAVEHAVLTKLIAACFQASLPAESRSERIDLHCI